MKKTQFKNQKSQWERMVEDYDKLERNLKQLRDVMAVICLQQEDHEVIVAWDEIAKIPRGTELEVSAAAGAGAQGFYVFRAITPVNDNMIGAADDGANRGGGEGSGEEGGGQGDRGDTL